MTPSDFDPHDTVILDGEYGREGGHGRPDIMWKNGVM